jgi:hypothetical protein
MVKSDNVLYLSSSSYITLPIQVTGSNRFFADFEEISGIGSFKLNQNYPNPFNPVTNISFTIPEEFKGLTNIKIYDISGREVTNLLNANMSAGEHSIQWDASRFASGIYFYRLQAGTFTDIKKMMLIK